MLRRNNCLRNSSKGQILNPESTHRFHDRRRKPGFISNLKSVHTGLMESPGHRGNLIQIDFGRVAIGIIDGGLNGIMVINNFRN